MLDNFGLGEFFFLAMLALLFFGPERLPRIGARLGRWVSSLTQYSKAFLTEWREEALAIHDAVEEVRGIRDELAAARAELSSTMDVAREDVSEGLEAAKDAVSGARLDVAQRMANQREETLKDLDKMSKEEKAEEIESASDEEIAIRKTQQILDDLQRKREATGAVSGGNGDDGTDKPDHESPESVGDTSQIDETALNLLTQEGEPELDTTEGSPQKVEAEEPPRESAFDRTQKILDNLAKQRSEKTKAEPPSEPSEPASTTSAQPGTTEALVREETEPEEPPKPPRESAFDRTQKILDDLAKRRSVKTEIETASTAEATEPVDQRAVELDMDTPSIDPYEFERLSAQVDQLQAEIAALRGELKAIQSVASQDEQAVAAEKADTSPDELPVEEAA